MNVSCGNDECDTKGAPKRLKFPRESYTCRGQQTQTFLSPPKNQSDQDVRDRSLSKSSIFSSYSSCFPYLDEPINDAADILGYPSENSVYYSILPTRRSSRSLDLEAIYKILDMEQKHKTILEVPLYEDDCSSFSRTNSLRSANNLSRQQVTVGVRTFNNNRQLSFKNRLKSTRRSIKAKFSRIASLRRNKNGINFPENSIESHHHSLDDNLISGLVNGIRKNKESRETRDVNIQSDEFGCYEDIMFDEANRQTTSSYLKEQFLSFFQPSDNKLAMKLFGNKNALNKEKRRQQQQGKWVIHPCSNFRFYWDLLMLSLLIANLIILPVAISFFNDDLSLKWIVFNCMSDTIFLLDIFVNFRTGVITNDFADEIVLVPKQIAQHYLKSWFALDFISSIPLDYIFLILNKKEYFNQIMHAGRALRILRLAKLLSLLRLLRLSRLVRYVSQWEELLNVASKFIGIFNLVLLMLLLGHWNACLQFLIPMLRDYPSDSWVIKCKLKDAYWFDQYTWALFKAMSHMLSIGYGRYPPTSICEAWITIVSMMTGATCYALFVGHAAALIQSFDTSKRLYREKFKQVEEYMAYRKLPRGLRQRIANYYEHRYQGKMFNELDILNELSECLREQIINYNCRALVAAVPFFTYADQNFVSEVVVKLQYEVFQPGDLIIKEGNLGTRMYFIQEGIVDIITKEGEVATSLSDGSYFGEICLLTNARRVASVRAETYCNVYSLDRDSFLSVLENYPLMRRTMESVAAERLIKIGQNPLLVSTRKDLTEDLKLVKEIVNESSSISSDDESYNENSGRRKSVIQIGLEKFNNIRSKAAAGIAKRKLSRELFRKQSSPGALSTSEYSKLEGIREMHENQETDKDC